jgi:hypothetical protein
VRVSAQEGSALAGMRERIRARFGATSDYDQILRKEIGMEKAEENNPTKKLAPTSTMRESGWPKDRWQGAVFASTVLYSEMIHDGRVGRR